MFSARRLLPVTSPAIASSAAASAAPQLAPETKNCVNPLLAMNPFAYEVEQYEYVAPGASDHEMTEIANQEAWEIRSPYAQEFRLANQPYAELPYGLEAEQSGSSEVAPMIFGIDTASVDENWHADWLKAKDKAEIRFGIIRANLGIWPDKAFKREWPRIKDAGLVRGAYMFLLFGKGRYFDPVAQAKVFIKTVGQLQPDDLPPSLDVEFPGGGRVKTGLSAKQCLDAVRAAWKVLKDNYGVAPIIYTSGRVWHEDLNDLPAPDLIESPLWLARYYYRKGPFVRNPKAFAGGRLNPQVPLPWGDPANWWIHQYQGDARGLPGFNQVDLNRFNTMTSGAKGQRVEWVQRRLRVPETGVFDAATVSALKTCKQRKSLEANDVVDLPTFVLLSWLNPVRRTEGQGETGEFQESEFPDRFELNEREHEFVEEAEAPGPTTASTVKARILWPALGFPAVVTPNSPPSPVPMRDGDASRCICVLVATNKQTLTPAEAAQHLRCVPWAQRGRRRIEANAFAANELAIRSDLGNTPLTLSGRKDPLGEHIRFGTNGGGQNGITACLANRVRDFYRQCGLAFLHEIRVSEAATARLANGQYHLFWNNVQHGEQALSDELTLLLDRFVRPQRPALSKLPSADRDFLFKGYMYEYGGLNAPYNRTRGASPPVPVEILHPLFICRNLSSTLRIGHVTDTHVDVRADVYEHNLNAAKIREPQAARAQHRAPRKLGEYDNFNQSFLKVYDQARKNSDVLLMTGDLIDYGRGHWGLGRAGQLQDDNSYFTDRNWFLFYYLLASGDAYDTPCYTILGNHDWRLNPYPPFAPGAPNPNELLHDHLDLTPDERKQIIALAHGDGYKRKFSYTTRAESAAQLLTDRFGSSVKAFIQMLGQTSNLEQAGFPTETSVESVAWYLFTINPFFDYNFTLPGKQNVLMLDWAKDEAVLFPIIRNGEQSGYSPLFPGDAAGAPKARSSLTGLQQKLVAEFLGGPSRAKIVGVHAPPVSPQPDWYDTDLVLGKKSYADPENARGPKGGHPFFAFTPSTHVTTPHGIIADRGSFGKEDTREWFIKAVADPRYSVRVVLSGHIHRDGIYVVYAPSQPVDIVNPKDPSRRNRLVNPLLVGGVNRLGDKGRKGPVYMTTASAGPRGNFEKRPLNARERASGGTTADPSYALLELTSDGALKGIRFVGVKMSGVVSGSPVAPQREMALAGW
jgi:lysozyme